MQDLLPFANTQHSQLAHPLWLSEREKEALVEQD